MKKRLAGQSFANGVLIRSDKNWSFADADGKISFGSLTSWLDHHQRLNIFLLRSIIGFIEMIAMSVKLQREGINNFRRDLLKPLIIYLSIVGAVMYFIVDVDKLAWSISLGIDILSFVLALAIFRKAIPGSLWAYHGAEHKVINAYELGVNLDDINATAECSRTHNRCGTILVVFLILISAFRISSDTILITLGASIGYFVLSIGLAIELFRLATNKPNFILSRLALAPGRALQAWVTTAEPDLRQLEVAVKAIQMVNALDSVGETLELSSKADNNLHNMDYQTRV